MRATVLTLLASNTLAIAAAAQERQAPAASARPLSLEQALELAEGASENVGIARAAVERARGERQQARSGYFPQLSGSATYTRTLESQFDIAREAAAQIPSRCLLPFVAQPTAPGRVDSLEAAVECVSRFGPAGGGGFENLPFGRPSAYNFGLSLSQNLFDGGRTSGRSRAANASLRRAQIGLTAAQGQLVLDVTEAYFDAVLADRLVAIAEASLEQADTTLSQTQLAREVGNTSEFDLLRARVTRDNQRPVLIRRRAERDIAYVRFKQLLNLPAAEPVRLTTPLGDTVGVSVQRVAALTDVPGDTTADVRAPVRQAAESVEQQRGLVGAARGERWPAVTVSSNFAQIAYPSDAFPGSDDFLTDWTIGVGVSVPLFTGGRISGSVGAARANLRDAELRLQQTREAAQVDARNTVLALEATAAAVEASQGTVEQASRAYSIAELRYREGLSTQTELLESRLQLVQAQANRARDARDYEVVRIRLALLPALPLGQLATLNADQPSPTPGTTVPANGTPTVQAGVTVP
ncbi:MAG TPA: TolC family protein [Gemmatimonadales bacterium]|nr:TolC family protein [Gemmatimonadales bacterium]